MISDQTTGMSPPADDSVSEATDILGALIRRKWLLVIGCLVGLGAGYLWYIQATPRYQSAAQIHVTSRGTSRIYESGQASMRGGYDEYMSGFYVSNHVLPTHVVLIKSPLIVGRAVANYKLRQLPSLADESAIEQTVLQGLSVERGANNEDGANVLTLTFTGTNADDSEKVLSAIVGTYESYLGDTYQDVSQETVQLITRAKDELHQQLTAKETEYREFRKNAPLLWQSENGQNIHALSLQNLQEARSAATLQGVKARARLKAIQNALDAGASRPTLVLLAKRLARSMQEANAMQQSSSDLEGNLLPLQIQERMLLQTYGPEHPRLKALREEMDLRIAYHAKKLQEKRAAEDLEGSESGGDFLEVYQKSLMQEALETEVQEQYLRAMFEKEKNEAKKLELFEVTDKTFQSEIERTKELYRGVVGRLQELNLVKDYGGYVTQVLASPSRGYQVEPKLATALGLAGFLGLLGGGALAFLVELSDKSFRSADEIRRQLGLQVVAHIPVLELEAKKGDDKVDETLVCFHKPKSREAEAYRRVRTSLFFSTQGQNHKVIQITSPDPSDGKTTLAINLASSIAQTGKRVLMIDADLRRPKLHRLFRTGNEQGLSQVLSAEAEISDVIQAEAIPNLDLMPCGTRPSNPSELLSLPRFQEVLDTTRGQYDFVIVDTPPVLAVTDPTVIAPCVDGVLVTIRLSKSGRPNSTNAVEQLAEVGGKILGVVVNGVGGASRYGYRYGGRAGSTYGGSAYYYYEYDSNYVQGRQYGVYYAEPAKKNGEGSENGAGGNGDS